MQARNFVGSALLVVGLLTAGCGGVAPEASEQSAVATREDELPDCSGQNYEYEYYSDASHTTLVGGRGCSCGAYFRWGTWTSYYDFYDYGACY